MATNFPTGLDSFNNPNATDKLNDAPVIHHVQHSNINDAVTAIERKLGVNLSSITTSVDYIMHLLMMTWMQHYNGVYKEVLPAGNPFPTSITWYIDVAKTAKVLEKNITYSSKKIPTTIVHKLYDGTPANNVLRTITDIINNQGPFELSRTRIVV